ncbi:guanidinobutyrase-like [Sycon ciliatum]|uniref:guanidinobutyrase-like n=1 Tax=Sycon ciliatum TaxID=27933 RepID=UPI0031F61F80
MCTLLSRRAGLGLVTSGPVLLASRCMNQTSGGFLQPNDPNSPGGLPRFAGHTTMMRLPTMAPGDAAEKLNACFLGVPMDWGTCNRPGTRYGPRYIRCESSLLRPYNTSTGAAPFESLQVADIGDVPVNPYSLPKSVACIEDFVSGLGSCRPLSMGGDHTVTLPILRALAKEHGKMALLHIDAHSDTESSMFGEDVAHGTTFYRACVEGLIDPTLSTQIGLRGGDYGPGDYDWTKEQGFHMVWATDCWYKSMVPLMETVRTRVGQQPLYISFDIDGLDPSIAPGTGTPEIGGLTTPQALEIIRGAQGLNVVGCDLVEVSPPYDVSNMTALTAANLLFEMLCVLPGVKYHK